MKPGGALGPHPTIRGPIMELSTTAKGWTGIVVDDLVDKITDQYSVVGKSGLLYRSKFPVAKHYHIGSAIVIAMKDGTSCLTDPNIYGYDVAMD